MRGMKRLELSDDIFIKVYDLRSYNNEVIRESINAMFKITKELREKVERRNLI
ncbi:hypothetical protein [Pyrococcus kukulkanii]|uniref:hypothetical protein n=1 Tax=Pyrococcus kukulkanii TaxID=1609559 RepID=UPI003564EE22